ncbi:cysteine desulfurase family protein [Paenibacillus mucilaginosus]|uniref:Aminotransferase class V n=1 Tax=Paenibacillus mucilaginosus (strain KNP414) TaxID=1036673 RepID=F8FM04_PAEMK|nr:cysteine desulfurase family protein [Paenibacillus mucilaginosus]AEI45630.1 Aminotransferase class V [Paenibacillus mucilaginosus KNP414]MCG7215171.1 cysteine desulfurase [Paenibacillus mucilaginosus]WDM27033.1 cysteine desulfurase [Paenibacillus mucilaginosus]
MIYLDNSATTRVHPEVLEAMLPYLQEEYGNPSSKHYTLAQNVKKATEEARYHVAQLIGCNSDEVIFTSGSTESNNMILKGVLDIFDPLDRHLVVSKTEHSSVIETAKFLESKRVLVTYLNVDKYGRVDNEELEAVIKNLQEGSLVSIIWGNNETGSLNTIGSIAELCKIYNVLFHTDATQVLGKIDVRNSMEGVRFLSCSAHKLHGPKGIGACIIKKDHLGVKTHVTPLIHGGGQEFDYRSGTLSTHNIIGFGKAAEIALREINETHQILKTLESHLVTRLNEYFSEILSFNNDDSNKIPGIINVKFTGVDNEFLIKELGDRVALASGSACSSTKPSHVLASMGLSLEQIRSSVRISLSKYNTIEEIDLFCKMLAGD